MDYNTVDLTFLRDIPISEKFFLDVFGGVRGAFIGEKFKRFYVGEVDVEATNPFFQGNFPTHIQAEDKISFNGTGLRAGSCGAYFFPRGFFTKLGADAAVLYGPYQTKLDVRSTSDLEGQPGHIQDIGTAHDNFYIHIPLQELDKGAPIALNLSRTLLENT